MSSAEKRRDKVYNILSLLDRRLVNPEAEHEDLDEQIMLELKSISAAEIPEPPENANLLGHPIWETIATAAMYASVARLWPIRPQHSIYAYIPNNEPDWLREFRIKWEEIRLQSGSTAIDLIKLLLRPRVVFKTLVKTNSESKGQ
jgi:hypothetical protein